MKVAFLHFFTFRLLRGIETLIVSLANELARKGVDVSIISATGTLGQTLIPVDRRVKVKAFPTFRYLKFQTIVPFYFFDLLKSHYDIVNIFFADFGEGVAVRSALKLAEFRLNLYICYPFEAAPHRFQSFRKWRLDKEADLIICDSRYVAEGAEAYFQRPCVVVPVGTDVDTFKPNQARRDRTRKQLGIDKDDVVLLNVSELEPRKGTLRVIEALPNVREKHPQIRYVILGRGGYRAALEKRVEELNLLDCVRFLGTTTDLVNFYNAADIFVMLPEHEANSIACHEAMACELPVVVSSSGGFQEVVDSTCGRIVNVEDRKEIVAGILDLAENAELRHRLGKRGRKVIRERLTWDIISNRLIDLYGRQVRG